MVYKFFVFPVQRDLLKYWLYHQQAIVQKIELTSFSLNIFNDVYRFAEIYQLYGSKESSSQNSIDDLMFNYSQVANHQLITFLMQRIENSRGFTN